MRQNTRIQCVEKIMAFLFWCGEEVSHAEFMPRDIKVNAIVYCYAQRRLHEAVRTKRSGHLWRSARKCTQTRQAKDLLPSLYWKLCDHPAHILDDSPSDCTI